MASQSIPRYARIPRGTLFPFHPVTLEDLQEAASSAYGVVHNGTKVTIEWKDKINPQRGGTYATIPLRYETLVRRFLYRGSVLAEVLYSNYGQKELDNDAKTNIRWNLLHFFRVLGECGPAFTNAAQQSQDVDIPFFDRYMVQEHFVGRHDPAAVIDWQREHPEYNLRTQDVFALGESSYLCPSSPQRDPERHRLDVP